MKSVRKALIKGALSAALAGVFAVAGSSAFALGEPIFQVQEGVVPGSAPNLITVNNWNFNYSATISQTHTSSGEGNFLNNDPFTESGFFRAGSFFNGASAPPQQLNGFGTTGYNFYGLFTLGGTATFIFPPSPGDPFIQATFT